MASTSSLPSPSTRQWAEQADASYTVNTRAEFRIPTRRDLARTSLPAEDTASADADGPSYDSIYLCGNSLGLQPIRTAERISQYLRTWATQGVFGHFKPLEGSPLPIWLDVDDEASAKMAPIVGASKDEVAVMQTLTANLHLLMAAFYTPTKERYKIIIESKAFPSDHYAVESQLRLHGLDPSDSMIFIEPSDPNNPILSTSHILSIIDAHASSTALLLLPGIQFYTGQFFDIPTITAHAQSRGIIVGWDLAHAVGNVPLELHSWNVDFAAWCSYKYLNGGPGCIAGAFVHSRHASVAGADYRPRLSGWWGNDKTSRFAMTNAFAPIPGAKGYQLSNPSTLDITALNASLEVFATTSMTELRAKSLRLTKYLEDCLLGMPAAQRELFSIITPTDPQARGAQLSVRLAEGLLGVVLEVLERESVVVDERKPDVIRVAPAPLYNTFTDVWDFVEVFGRALNEAVAKKGSEGTHELAMTT